MVEKRSNFGRQSIRDLKFSSNNYKVHMPILLCNKAQSTVEVQGSHHKHIVVFGDILKYKFFFSYCLSFLWEPK